MGKNIRKIISIGLAVAMISGSMMASPRKVYADSDIQQYLNGIINEKQYKELGDAFTNELTSINDAKVNEKMFNDNAKSYSNFKPYDKVRVIIEMDESAVVDYLPQGATAEELTKASTDSEIVQRVLQSQEGAINQVMSIDSNATVNRRYTTLINGFSIETEYKNLKNLEQMVGVKSVSIAERYTADMNNAKAVAANMNKLWNELKLDGEGMLVSIIDTGIDYEHQDMELSSGKVGKLDIDEVNAIKDTLIGSEGQYFTEKIPFGYNYTSRRDNYENNGPLNIKHDNNTSPHGSHVAGIVGANCTDQDRLNSNEGIKGVAPETQLLAMKVFSNNPKDPYAYSDDTIAAIEDSIKLGADVINMSLGSSAGFQTSEEPQSRAIRKATESGVMVVVSAGNSGYSTDPLMVDWIKDTGIVGSPGVTNEALQVASFENTMLTVQAARMIIDGNSEKIPMTPTESSAPAKQLQGQYQLVDCGVGKPEDFKGKDLSGKIALIKRGEIDFATKQINAQNAGATAVIVYNNEAGGDVLVNMVEGPGLKIPAMFIGNTAGRKFVNNQANAKIEFRGEVTVTPNTLSGQMSSFSSWGPTPNLDFKPEITGVGGNVYSTIGNGEYGNMSGTSMSSPFVAGFMALYKQSLVKEGMTFMSKDEESKFIKANAINTAIPLNEITPLGETTPVSPRRQGAGMVNVEGMINNKVLATYEGEATAALKQIDNKVTMPISLTNYGTKSMYYKPVLMNNAVYSQQEEFMVYKGMMFNQEISGATVEFEYDPVTIESKASELGTTTGAAIKLDTTTGSSIGIDTSKPTEEIDYVTLYEAVAQGALEVKPGETVTVYATLTIPENTNIDKFVEGFIRFVPVNPEIETIGIPFMGFYGDWGSQQMFDPPVYDDMTLYGIGQMTTVIDDEIYFVTKQDRPDLRDFAMNPKSETKVNNLLPVMSLYRNARYFKVEVQDENGRVVRNIANEEYIRKNYSEQELPAYAIPEWTWYGKDNNGNILPDGNYEVVIKGKADFMGSDWQELRMPAAIDTLAPTATIKNTMNENVQGDEIEIIFEADDATKLYAAALVVKDMVTGETVYVRNQQGDIALYDINKLYDKETGEYKIKCPLLYDQNEIGIVLYDGVGNYSVAGKSIAIKNSIQSPVNITNPVVDKIYGENENVVVEWSYNGLETLTYEVSLVKSNGTEVQTTSEKSYNFGKLPLGQYAVTVKATNENGEVIGMSTVKFKVGEVEQFIVENLTSVTSFRKGEQANVKIKVTNTTQENKEATLIIALFDENNRMIMMASAGKNVKAGEVEQLSSMMSIPEKGEYKLKAFVWDNLESAEPLSNVINYIVE